MYSRRALSRRPYSELCDIPSSLLKYSIIHLLIQIFNLPPEPQNINPCFIHGNLFIKVSGFTTANQEEDNGAIPEQVKNSDGVVYSGVFITFRRSVTF
ncbi:MAG: hypothetical protein RR510_17845, partial [Morganella sp. (in: enterobacteria)]